MVLTTLEARVAEDAWDRLRAAFAEEARRDPPPQLVRSYLVQSVAEPTLWRIHTVWKSRAALEEMRRSVDVPAGVLMFRAAGAEPALSLAEVRDTVSASASAPA